ncbi:MAG: pitrilysin family protein [Syntrophotaleaceae bacterium]
MKDYRLDTLANGLRLLTVPMPHLHSAELACYVGVGSRFEPRRLAGISHFLEHMLFRGSVDYPSNLDLEWQFEAIGGTINAATDAETTCYHSRLHPDQIGKGLELLASMLRRPLFKDVEIERKIILEEALEDLNQDGEEISPDLLMARLLWPDHPLSQPTIGLQASIAAMTTEDLLAHHRTYYVPANTVIALAGRIDRQAALQAAETIFGDWQGDQAPSAPPLLETVGDSGPGAVWKYDPDSQVNIQIAFKVPGRESGHTPALRMLRRVLSGGGTARLMLELRENLGLTYNAEAHLTLFVERGSFTVDLSVMPDNLVRAVNEVLAIFEDLCAVPVGERELERAVRNYLYDLDFTHDHADVLANRYGWGLITGYLKTLDDEKREAVSVNSSQMQITAREVFTRENLRMAVVGPFAKKDRRQVEKRLAGFRA